MSGAAFKAVRRATLWIPGTGPDHDKRRGHLFVILTEPGPKGNVLVVPICSADKKFDATCIVGAGDHHFLKHKSYIAYHKLSTYSAAVLETQVQKKAIQYHGMLDEKVFALVCEGIENSREAAPKFKNYYKERTQTKPAKNN
jgi:hypothetical protein